MGRTYKGSLSGSGQRHALVVSSFNAFITEQLLQGAKESLETLGLSEDCLDVAHVPGAFELGPAALVAAKSGRYDAITCLGCVIRGATAHFDYVADQAARLVAQASYDSGLPIIFGVLTTDTIEQAIKRADTKAGNKGGKSIEAAVEMVNLYRQLQK